jgi:hypothetical protein
MTPWCGSGRGRRHQFILKEWETAHHATDYRALLREELEVGLTGIRWHLLEEGGWYQPLVTARRS